MKNFWNALIQLFLAVTTMNIFQHGLTHTAARTKSLQLTPSEVFFQNYFILFLDTLTQHILFLITTVNTFWGDLSSISAKTATLLTPTASVFEVFFFFGALIQTIFYYIMKINSFPGIITDTSAAKEALLTPPSAHPVTRMLRQR